MRKISFVLCSILITAPSVYAQQKGFLRGKIIDKESGEALIGATVSKQGTTIGAVADFDGNYSLSLDAGTHTVVFNLVSHQRMVVSDIDIQEDSITRLDTEMSPDFTELDEVVVTAEVAKDTDIGLLIVQKKSMNMTDGISSQTFRKTGDGDLAAAMKRVTGVSVQAGKYVYVRGIGDRYTKVTVNGMGIPGLDPDKNAVQIDIFPTNTIENVVVYKTFTPDLAGDFSGGIVDIETKSFPDKKTTNISFGVGFNPDMHFNSNAITYRGGKTDFAGFDDGTRRLPFSKSTNIPNTLATNGADAEGYTRAFTAQLSAKTKTNFMNYRLSVNHGNQIDAEKATIGYNVIFNYGRNDEFFENVEYGEYTKSFDKSVSNLNGEEIRRGAIGNKDVMWNALAGGTLEFEDHSFSVSLLRSQNGISSASKRINVNLDDNPSKLQVDILTYTQRSLTSGMLIGKHNFDKFEIVWKGALNWSAIYEPDFRSTRLEMREDSGFGLNTGVGAGVDRSYRNLTENNQSFKADITYRFGGKNKLKFGTAATFKKRDFDVIEYFFRNIRDTPITGNADDLLGAGNIWTPTTNKGLVARGDGLNSSKTFNASKQVFGGYAMTDMQVLPKMKVTYGVRAEKAAMYYSGEDQKRSKLNNQQTLNELDILPSANLVYTLTDGMNLRGSYNRTLARPSFKEKSNAQIFDPISSRTFLGNLRLEQTRIDNYDLRWEYFFGKSEMISLSGFYKRFYGHIELTSFDTAPDQITARNAGKSTVSGVEIEFRKDVIKNISLGINASFVKSAIDLKSAIVNDRGTTEYELRQNALREGETLESTREMAGQSPYLFNGYVNVSNPNESINVNVSYNVQGETLNIVGSGNFPDVYTKPFHSLNLSLNKHLGKDHKSTITVGVNNILKSEKKNYFKSYQSREYVYSVLKPGRTFSLKYSYTF